MTQLVPFDSDAALPAYLSTPGALADINKDVVRAAQFPSMSIRGKVFTLNQDGVKKIITKPNDPDEVAQSIGVVIVRASMTNKTFYLKKFAEGESDGVRPDCYSHDGVAPSPNSPAPQSKKCAVCPHNQWGSRMGDGDKPGEERKGKACADNARLAIATPDKLDKSMLLRVPPASLKNLREAVKIANTRKIPYNAVVMKVSFDPEASSPTLKFKPVGLLPDADYAKATEQYDSDLVRAIVGLDEHMEEAPVAPPAVGADELDAAIAARDAAQKAAQTSAPPAPPAEAPAPAPAPAKPKATRAPAAAKPPAVNADDLDQAMGASTPPAPAPAAPASDMGSMLSDIDALLGNTDD